MPRHMSQIQGTQLFMLAKLEGPSQADACRERMRREIMYVDNVDWYGATDALLALDKSNSAGLALARAPYQLTWGAAFLGGWISLPLVFYLPVARWFNKFYVTMDVPEKSDLDTMLEVGSWTWNWMEPPLGTVSFFLLCMQFAREASTNLGSKPPAVRHREMLAQQLQTAFPQYCPDVVADYAMATAFDDDSDNIQRDNIFMEAVMAKKKGGAEKEE